MVTVEQFAKWSFERDLAEGCFEEDHEVKSWDDLPQDEKKLYLDEAQMYFSMSLADWPIDILERIQLSG